jgi:hypothetical protein
MPFYKMLRKKNDF